MGYHVCWGLILILHIMLGSYLYVLSWTPQSALTWKDTLRFYMSCFAYHFSTIKSWWHDSWEWQEETCHNNIFIIMSIDELAMQDIKASSRLLQTYVSCNILLPVLANKNHQKSSRWMHRLWDGEDWSSSNSVHKKFVAQQKYPDMPNGSRPAISYL